MLKILLLNVSCNITEFRSIFDMFDKNSDGKISCDELGVVLRTLGHRYSQTEVEEMIKNVDKNGKLIAFPFMWAKAIFLIW